MKSDEHMSTTELNVLWSGGGGGAERQFALYLDQHPGSRGLCFYGKQRPDNLGGDGVIRGLIQILTIAYTDRRISIVCWMYRAAFIGVLVRLITLGGVPVLFQIRHGLSGKVKLSRRIAVYFLGVSTRILNIPCVFNSNAALDNHAPYGFNVGNSVVKWNVIRQVHLRQHQRNEIRIDLGIPVGATVICSIGRNAAEKNYQSAVRAFSNANLPDSVIYLIVGAGCSIYGNQKSIVGINHMNDIDLIYSAVDMIFIPSETESLSNVLCEAISCNLPIASTVVGDSVSYSEHMGYSKIEFGGHTMRELTGLLQRAYHKFLTTNK